MAELVMPGLDPGIHVLLLRRRKDVDGRVKPGHDDLLLLDAGGLEHFPIGRRLAHDEIVAAIILPA